MSAFAGTKTCNDLVVIGTSDSAVDECVFLTKSKGATKIFNECGDGDLCKITAILDGPDGVIKKVLFVKRLKGAQ